MSGGFAGSRELAGAGSVSRRPPVADEPFRTIIEPFRIHSVEPMRLTTRAGRTRIRRVTAWKTA